MSDLQTQLLERVGRIEAHLWGSGDSFSRVLGSLEARLEHATGLEREIEELETRIEARLVAIDDRLSRQRENLQLRALIRAIDSVPGGWRGLFVLQFIEILLIDLAIDAIGAKTILARFLGL